MNSINIKGAEIKVGDSITVYTKRGANVNGKIEQIDAGGTAYVSVKRAGNNAHSATGWYEIKVSSRGIPYASE